MSGVADIIGNTPMVELLRLNPNPGVKIYAKLEGNNPGGSVKDRPAYNMIKAALDRGSINRDTVLIEATSGNTGIGTRPRGGEEVLVSPAGTRCVWT